MHTYIHINEYIYIYIYIAKVVVYYGILQYTVRYYAILEPAAAREGPGTSQHRPDIRNVQEMFGSEAE